MQETRKVSSNSTRFYLPILHNGHSANSVILPVNEKGFKVTKDRDGVKLFLNVFLKLAPKHSIKRHNFLLSALSVCCIITK